MTDAARRRRVEEVCDAALERDAPARGAFVAAACGSDDGLRQEVEALLGHADTAERFLAEPIGEVAARVLDGPQHASPVGRQTGPYMILSLLGSGGMGEVYRARDTTLNRDVALKILPRVFAADIDRLARFRREAQVLASLNHPNIAHVYGLEQADDLHAFVMELVDGPTLADRIAQGPIPVDEALPIAKQIAEALEAAHEQGVIHRDLKPANIKVRPDGTVKVLDFGLAKALEPRSGTQTDATASPTMTSPAMMTGAGVILGTTAYMSPEQARGKPVDKRTDIWAFGCVVYEMLTGRRAFPGDEVSDVLASVLARDPDWAALPRGLSPVLTAFLKRCLHKDRRQRIGDTQSIRLALEGAFETAQDVSQSAAIRPPFWRRAIPVAAALIVGALAVAVLAWSRWPSDEPRTVSRFAYDIPPDHTFRSDGRSVLAISPDGRRFVYNTQAGLFIRSMGALEGRLVPGTETKRGNVDRLLAPASPFFAPDGESVGYFEGGQLKRIDIDGGASFVICAAEPSFGATWSADNTILFAQSAGIMRVSANGGTPELLVPAGAGDFFYGPQLLPDGDLVLFTVTTAIGGNRWDAAQIAIQSLSSGERTIVTQGSDGRYVPTGHVVFAVDDALFAIPFDLDRREVRGGPVPVVDAIVPASDQALQTPAANYGISDTGTLLYLTGTGFVPPDPFGTLVWVDRRGYEQPLGPPLGPPSRRYAAPRLSPDGTRVAFEGRDQGGDIWIWEIRRQVLTRFTSDPANDVLPVWSPDGSRLFWGSDRAGGLNNLYSQSADGSGAAERMTVSPNSQRPHSFTPDGTRLLFAEADPTRSRGRAILAMLLPMESDRRVASLGQPAIAGVNAEISPDGRWLAYESDETGEPQVYVQPFPDSAKGRAQVSTRGGREPLWARSGRELFYLAPDGTLMGMPVETARRDASFAAGIPVPVVAAGPYFRETAFHRGRSYDVAPDAARFLRIKVEVSRPSDVGTPRTVVIVQNWFEELKRLVPTP